MSQTLKVAIMQPYFLPYIGYWQLMKYVDIFVVYDNIKYTKKSWIRRNRFLLNGKPEIYSLPLKQDSDHLDIRDRELSKNFRTQKLKLVRRLESAYQTTENFKEGKTLLTKIFECTEENLFLFINKSIENIRSYLGLKNLLVISSTLDIPTCFKGQDRVIAICKELGATDYINPIGGKFLYSKKAFNSEKIRLHFHKTQSLHYQQFEHKFVHNLSIIDPIMFLGVESVKVLLSKSRLGE